MNHEQTRCATSVARPMLLFTGGAAGAVIARRLLVRCLLFKFRRNIAALNAGDYQPVLSSYAEDAVLHFNEGPHRWAGEHRGKLAIASFLQSFVDAEIQGEITELFISGPPWRMTLLVRFDDQASASTGEEIYRNRTVLLARTRWGRIVRQEDFYEDTQSINTLETRLSELGVHPTRTSLKWAR